MSFFTEKVQGKHRVIDTDTGRIAVRGESSVDGGGYDTEKKAQQQADAINRNVEKRKKDAH